MDDEKNPLIIAKTFLESVDPDLKVNILSSPGEALKLFDSYHCIIADYRMPRMDGVEFSRRIREVSDVPIILYTAWGSEDLQERARMIGVDDCVPKGSGRAHFMALASSIKSTVRAQREGRRSRDTPLNDVHHTFNARA